MKTCTKCNVAKPPQEFYRRLGGATARCKGCIDVSNKEWRKNNPEKRAAADARHHQKYFARYKEASRKWERQNRERLSKRRTNWIAINREHYEAYHRAWYEQNKERRQEQIKAWRKANPDKTSAISKSGHLRRWGLIESQAISKRYSKEIIRIYKNCPPGHQVDHIVPIRGKTVTGLHVPWNLQYLPQRENLLKGNRHWPDMPT